MTPLTVSICIFSNICVAGAVCLLMTNAIIGGYGVLLQLKSFPRHQLKISASDQLQYPALWAHRHTGSQKTKEKTTNEKVTALTHLATAL